MNLVRLRFLSVFPHRLRTMVSCALVGGATVASSMPTWGQCEQSLAPSDSTNEFGYAVAIDAEWLVAGARFDSSAGSNAGSAYFFNRPSLVWTETQEVTAMDTAPSDVFGSSVSISGDFAVIGSPNNGGLGSGAAYVFERVSGTWVEAAKLLAPDGGPGISFGTQVSICGGTAVVGSSIGAYVFELVQDLGWVFVDKLEPGGRQVALAGDHILTGLPVNSFERRGQVWTHAGTLAPTGDSSGFGVSVSISADWAAIGAPGANDLGTDSGATYVFAWNGATWGETERLLVSDGFAEDQFGWSVAISEARLLASAPGGHGSDTAGAAYVFEWDGIEWEEVSKLEASDGAADDLFGYSVALQGDDGVVGALYGGGSGAAYAFSVPCTDCNGNQTLDAVDIATGASEDCNSNGVPDECDIAGGASQDCQPNGIPDECDAASFASVYCYCDTGAPCGNVDPDAGCANVTGGGAAVSVCGTPSIAADDLYISARGLLPNVSGLFFMGGGDGMVFPFGDGQRCVLSGPGQSVKRYRPTNGGASGTISLGPVASIAEMRFGAGVIAPGQTWNFQCWYRDPIGPCGSGYNTSNAVRITFAP